MRSSPRSKPSMASAIDTATAEPAVRAAPSRSGSRAAGLVRAGPRRAAARARSEARAAVARRRPALAVVSPLTRRIVAVNVLALALLAVGFLYLGKFEASLVGQQIESLQTQGEIFAAALGEGAVLDSADEGEILLPDLARQMMRRLVEPTRTRARLFDTKGELIADSRLLRGPGDAVQVLELPAPRTKGRMMRLADRLYDWIVDLLPPPQALPVYHERPPPPRIIREVDGGAARRERVGGSQRPGEPAAWSSASRSRCSATSRCSARSCCRPATARSRRSCAPCGSNCCGSSASRCW